MSRYDVTDWVISIKYTLSGIIGDGLFKYNVKLIIYFEIFKTDEILTSDRTFSSEVSPEDECVI